MDLCVPLTDAFRRKQEELLRLVSAVSFKKPSAERFAGKVHFLESSHNISSPDFPGDLSAAGILEALHSGKYASFACDIGPICKTRRGCSRNGFPRALPIGPEMSRVEYIARASKNMEWLRGECDGYIQVENLNYFPTGGYEVVCETRFVRELIEASGVGLLLDIPHAVISANNLGYKDPMGYIRELPLHAVREVHVSRAGVLNEELEDLHEVPGDQELSLVRRLLEDGCGFKYLTVEFYRDPDELCSVYHSLVKAFGVFPDAGWQVEGGSRAINGGGR